MRETDDECLRGAMVVVDTVDAIDESGDLAGPVSRAVVERADIKTLSQVIERHDVTPFTANVVFKAVGVAMADLAVAEHLCELS